MFVKPAPGQKVRHPVSKKLIPDEGCEVPESSFWLRRVACGDVLCIAEFVEPVLNNIQIPDSCDSEGEN